MEPEQKKLKTSHGGESSGAEPEGAIHETIIDKLAKLDTLHEQFVNMHNGMPPEIHSMARQILDEFVQYYEDSRKKIVEAVGNHLHSICWSDIGDSISPSIDKMIDCSPQSLSHQDGSGDLPSHTAASSSKTQHKLLPYFVEKAIEHKVFPEADRGGLFILNPRVALSPLDMVCIGYSEEDEGIRTLKVLREKGLLHKSDIDKRNIFEKMLGYDCQKRFNFLVDWHPKGLIVRKRNPSKGNSQGNLPIHGLFKLIKYFLFEGGLPEGCKEHGDNFDCIKTFRMFLRGSIRHYPQAMGFLFAKDENGVTALDLAVEVMGLKDTLAVVKECIPQEDERPILHKVLKNAPHHFNEFVRSYPDAVFDRNAKGRLLLHTALAQCIKLSGGLMLAINCPEGAIHEYDPVTGLSPFMMAAVGTDTDLTTIFYLIRRKPGILIDLTSQQTF